MNRITLRPRHPVRCVAVCPDGRTVAAYQPHFGVSLVPICGSDPAHVFPLRGDLGFRKLVFHPDGYRLLGFTAGHVFAADWRGSPAAATARAYDLQDVAFVDAGRAVDLVYGYGIRRYETGHLFQHLSAACREWPPANATSFRHRELSPDGRHLLADGHTGHRQVRLDVYAYPAQVKLGTLVTGFTADGPRHGLPPVTAAFTSAGDRVAVAAAGGIDVFGWPPPPPPSGPAPAVTELPPQPAWKRRLKRFARAAAKTVFGPPPWPGPSLVPPGPGRPRLPEVGPAARLPVDTRPDRDRYPPPFAFTLCGRLLVRGGRDRIELWDAAAGAKAAEWDWGLSDVRSVAVAGNGLVAASGGRHGRLVIWDLE